MSSILSERLFAKYEAEFRPHIREIGLGDEMFTDPSTEISVECYIRLLEATAASGHSNIGLEMGNSADFRDFGILGYAIGASATVLEALQILTRYIFVFAHDNTFRVDRSETRLSVTYRFNRSDIKHHRHDAEFAIAAVFRLLQKAAVRALQPLEIEFAHERPADVACHRDVFGCPVHFGCGLNRLHLNRSVEDFRLKDADARLLEVLEDHLTKQLRLRSTNLSQISKVRHLIGAGLHQGIPAIDTVASRLGLSRRSLQRQLGAAGTSFSDLVDEVRAAIAQDYVRQTDMKISEIAHMLSYNEASSFSRAYQRWTGTSPLEDRSSKLHVT